MMRLLQVQCSKYFSSQLSSRQLQRRPEHMVVTGDTFRRYGHGQTPKLKSVERAGAGGVVRQVCELLSLIKRRDSDNSFVGENQKPFRSISLREREKERGRDFEPLYFS